MNILSIFAVFDYKIALDIVAIRTPFLNSFFSLFTWLGSSQSIILIFIIVSVALYYHKKENYIYPLFVSIFGSGIMVIIIKYFVNRARPGVGIAIYQEQLSSFPSAHAALIMALFGFLIYCIWRFNLNLKIKIGITIIFTVIILLVGFSRLYLGVHFLSDVLAGYLIGLMWLLIARHITSISPSLVKEGARGQLS